MAAPAPPPISEPALSLSASPPPRSPLRPLPASPSVTPSTLPVDHSVQPQASQVRIASHEPNRFTPPRTPPLSLWAAWQLGIASHGRAGIETTHDVVQPLGPAKLSLHATPRQQRRTKRTREPRRVINAPVACSCRQSDRHRGWPWPARLAWHHAGRARQAPAAATAAASPLELLLLSHPPPPPHSVGQAAASRHTTRCMGAPASTTVASGSPPLPSAQLSATGPPQHSARISAQRQPSPLGPPAPSSSLLLPLWLLPPPRRPGSSRAPNQSSDSDGSGSSRLADTPAPSTSPTTSSDMLVGISISANPSTILPPMKPSTSATALSR